MKSVDLYNKKQEFLGFLETIKKDVDYTIRKANSTWTNTTISAAEDLLDVLDYYRTELAYYRDTLQYGLDKLEVDSYTEEEVNV